jgi:ubiquinone/menaquinone biosynthesis C-methylase UbiE
VSASSPPEEAGVPGGPAEKRLRRLRFLYAPFAHFAATHAGPRPVVVDLGTGSGLVLERMREQVPEARLIGFDIRRAPMQLGSRGLTFVQADAVHLPLVAESVDVVVSRSSFGYWHDHETALTEILRVLKPGGVAYVVDVNAGPIGRLLIIGLGMVLLGRGYADMREFCDRALSRKSLIALLGRVGVARFDCHRLFLGTYMGFVLRKPVRSDAAENGRRVSGSVVPGHSALS